MSIRRKAAAVLAGTVLACGLLSAGTASAAAPTGHTRQAAFETYTVVPLVDAPIRSGPGNGHPVIGRLRAGYSYSAFCWLSGETVVDHGSTSHIWVHLSGGPGIGNGWVSALYLRGDERADLPASAQC
ncbi:MULTISPECIES: SH3 domain-containing protein [unclassified Streptomyces]|uniref:SH3 domain-containing protein n=1 Tax=unclassified Streptomyces TaxID=2593676 RepID=UPI001162BB69|nr:MULTISPECIES: SH3 domain-containing protein [unclassified Streptomyces]NMI55518.1 SH3 domain-containing protein [Streptomyces sp. RLA2-12]QDN55023.1 SH3 domain-containing protein [Streptomyces sp. S1D4-20]QDN65202.1 SH3 domain-containing protein [Streptomyces sp. S1D4-14]QDN75576.1 SH3 domain-containing protein [Streptomyces sp. S1A1-7]QDN95760.1 SH3 domain-containing protein [Streptomyces sp. RLB1-9]